MWVIFKDQKQITEWPAVITQRPSYNQKIILTFIFKQLKLLKLSPGTLGPSFSALITSIYPRELSPQLPLAP